MKTIALLGLSTVSAQWGYGYSGYAAPYAAPAYGYGYSGYAAPAYTASYAAPAYTAAYAAPAYNYGGYAGYGYGGYAGYGYGAGYPAYGNVGTRWYLGEEGESDLPADAPAGDV